jgi:glycosyltransferase involved in cell wall biosynthesis
MINIVAPINQLGYGITGLNIVKHLSKLTDVSLICIGQPQVTTQEDADIIKKALQNAKFLDFDAPCIKIWHQHDMTQFAGRGKRIGFPIFELNKFTNLEKHHLQSLDSIFVCSDWAKNIVLQNIEFDSSNIHVIPLGVDTSIFKSSTINVSYPTRFFNCGKWEIRKGHDVLVELFNSAFDVDDNVELWLMCENPFCSQEEKLNWENTYYRSKLGSKIRIIPRQNTQEEVYSIMAQTHCGVFPSRAEGWNLELLEMMACGKHVITTNYSAHTQFCNSENSMLVSIANEEPANDNKWFHGQGDWAKIGIEQCIEFIKHMKTIHNKRQAGDLNINTAGISTAQQFTWEHSSREIMKHVL